jgi:hypothetical protein
MQQMVTMANAQVEGCVSWLCPFKVNFKAMPKALTDMTDTDPTVEHIDMYMSGFLLPYMGAIL